MLLVLHALGGSCAAGLATVIWMMFRQGRDPIPCFLDACETEMAVAAVLVTGTYFAASVGAGAALGLSEMTGAGSTRIRSWMAFAGPPALWVVVFASVA